MTSSSSLVAVNPAFVLLSLFGIRLGCRRSGKLQSFFADAIAPNTFLRKVPPTILVSGSTRQRTRADATYLVRIPHRQRHSTQSDVLLASATAGRCRRIHGPNRVGPDGRDLKLPAGNSDRTTGPKLASALLLSVLSDATAASWRPRSH